MTQALKIPAPLSRPGGVTIDYVDATGVLRILSFDATLQGVHNAAAEASSAPLDTNAIVTDHVRASPRAFTLDVEVTNTPLIPPEGFGGVDTTVDAPKVFRDYTRFASAFGTAGVFVPFAGTVGAQAGATPALVTDAFERDGVRTIQYPTPFNRCKDVFDALETLRRNGTPVRVVSKLATYEEVVIVNLVVTEDPSDAIMIGVDFVEIRRAESQTIRVDPPVAEKRAQKAKASGSQAKYEPSTQTQSTARLGLSALADIVAR